MKKLSIVLIATLTVAGLQTTRVKKFFFNSFFKLIFELTVMTINNN